MKLGAKELRISNPTIEDLDRIKRNPIWIVLDNVLDTYNIGAIFRLADAVAASGIYLCGDSPIPPDHKIKKASVGTWQWVDWQYVSTAVEAVAKIKNMERCKIIAVEQHERSIPYTQMKVEFPLAIVVGNETYGVSKEVVKISDQIVEIPMWGINKSLNVMVSCAIVLYKAMEQIM